MSNDDIKTVVKATIDELLGGSMIKYSDLIIYERMSDRLREYYKGKPDEALNQAIYSLRDHAYIDLLELYYADNMTLEQLAEKYDVDISTITRNKKHLCIKLFELTI